MDISARLRPSYMQPITCKNKEVYSELNTLIYEYLEVNGLEQALHIFTKECQSKNLPCPKPNAGTRDSRSAFSHYDGEQLLKSFDDGDLEIFQKLWKRFQTHIQVTSQDMKKLEVYLQVHFAIWPKAKNQSEARQNQAMQTLKAFFEEHSASLSSDATILPLFALPFVPDPRPHPIFKDLFHDSWTTKLRAQLETTVNKYFELLQENITTHCKLASVVVKSKRALSNYHQNPGVLSGSGSKRSSSKSSVVAPPTQATVTDKKSSKATNNNNAAAAADMLSTIKLTESAVIFHQERFFHLVGIHKTTRKTLRGMRENYGKLLKICNELLLALEKASGESNAAAVLQKCVVIFPELFMSPSETTLGSKPNLEYFKQVVTTTVLDTPLESDISLLFLGMVDIGPDALNYEKIKESLMCDKISLTEKLCLLQALRWMITKTTLVSRSHVIGAFVENDILGIATNKGDLRQKLFSCLLSPNPTYQKESLARLINAFASAWAGRSYLTSTDFVIDILIKSLSTFKSQTESFICHMVIATLQKLSLRKSMRKTMIEQNVIPWMVKYIKVELDRDIIRDEVQQMTNDWRSGSDGVSTVDIENNQCSSNHSNGNGNMYGDTFNIYLMEYAWALLMNLCLHEESIKSSLIVDFEFLHCIVAMLTSKTSFEFTPYVLSTLFSLLRSPEMFEKAKTMNLDKKLGPVIDRQSDEVASHLRHLISQLYQKENVDRLTASGETDYDDSDNPDPEEIELELELPESWMNNQTEMLLTGDDLIIREYLLQREIPSFRPFTAVEDTPGAYQNSTKEIAHSSNSVDSTTVGLILRPTTPTRNILKNSRTKAHANPAAVCTYPPTHHEASSKNHSSNHPKGIIAEADHPPKETLNQGNPKVSDGLNKKVCNPMRKQPQLVPSSNPFLLQEQPPRAQFPQLVPFTTTTTTSTPSKTIDSEVSSFTLHESPAVSFPAGQCYKVVLTPSLQPLQFSREPNNPNNYNRNDSTYTTAESCNKQ